MKINQLLLISVCSYFNPLTIYWFNFAYQGITDLVIGLLTSFLASLFLLYIFSRHRILKRKVVGLSLAFISSIFSCILVWTAHSLEAGLGLTGYVMRGNFALINYLFIMVIMPTFWLNIFCFFVVRHFSEKRIG